MICTAQTVHGAYHHAAGIKLGPIPTRFWVGDDEPPTNSLVRISPSQWDLIKDKAERGGGKLLHVEQDVSAVDHLTEALDRASELADALAVAKAEIETLGSEREQLREALAEQTKSHDQLVAEYRDELARLQERYDQAVTGHRDELAKLQEERDDLEAKLKTQRPASKRSGRGR